MTFLTSLRSALLPMSLLVVAVQPVRANSVVPLTTNPDLIRPVMPVDLTLSTSPQFTCAPHLETFVVKPLDQRSGTGIRCVKFSEGRPGGPHIPKLAWYGEGHWYGKTYRHVGHAFYENDKLVGAAADFKEQIHNNFPYGTLKVTIVNPDTIRVTGAWNEVWQRKRSVAYRPLPRPTSCGQFFNEYKVEDTVSPIAGGRKGDGLRCALTKEHIPTDLQRPSLPLTPGITTWFGNGYWGVPQNTYSHLGTYSYNGYGAGDICGNPFGPTCGNFGWGSLKITPTGSGYQVNGAWRENWIR
jgi:hypothetical protein